MKPLSQQTRILIQKVIDRKWIPIVNKSGADQGCCELCLSFVCGDCPAFQVCSKSYYEWDLYQEKHGPYPYKVFDNESERLALNILNGLKKLLE